MATNRTELKNNIANKLINLAKYLLRDEVKKKKLTPYF